MTKFLDKFLEFKNEADATRKFALLAVVIITLGLASLSVTGIIATATWTFMSALPTLGLILAVLGAEALATVAFIRTLTAPTMARKVAGSLIFIGLAAIGVHNAENGAKTVWPDRYAVSSGKLSAQAELAGEEAATLKTAQDAAIGGTGGELDRVRQDIADLKIEQETLANNSPEGIERAQRELQAKGLYNFKVDGISNTFTEKARRERGEQVQRELTKLKAREDGLMQGQASPVMQANTDKRLEQIDNADKAAAAFWAWFWLILMLCTLEGARSLSLWALITDIQSGDVDIERQRAKELADAEHANKLAALRAAMTPAPVEAPAVAPPPEPAPEAIPEPVEAVVAPATVDTQKFRDMALASAQARAARKAQADLYIPVPSLVARDADAQAEKVAAQ